MSFADAFRTCMSKYATFSGRARRSEFWFFYLAYVVLYAVAAAVFGGIGSALNKPGIAAVAVVVLLALALPMLAAVVRRLHDTGRSGWWYFIGLVPFVGPIVMIVFLVQDSVPGDNAYGPSPKAVPAAPVAPAVGY